MALEFDRPEKAAEAALRELGGKPDAVLAVDDSGVELAALLAERLGLPGNPAGAVRRTRDKLSFRRLLVERGFLCPRFRHLPSGRDPRELGDLRFPCVVKARRLSASRGVIRANNPEELLRAVNWVRAIQASADRDAEDLGIVIEDFIPGAEYALEGALQSGELVTLALFDKPDPLDGPYFEETIYVTPSRLPTPVQRRITT
jgi:biotin carboxylase